MKCPVCKFSKCRWIELKDPAKLPTEKLESVVKHNLSYIEMVFSGNQGSAHAEERMYNSLAPYTEEIEKRKKSQAAQFLGAKGGRVKSEAKRAAARRNGKKGGRPRKDKKK